MVILFDQYNLPENVYEVVFATDLQIQVGEMLVNYIKKHGGVINKRQMSAFAKKLHRGDAEYNGEKISYNKRQFYDRILTPMKAMGLVAYDMYERTYSISKKFCAALDSISEKWSKEYDKS
ncbi:MAG: hypothetical protein MAG795_00653 [Candidatus Woesearchaeota archaeon]|nr:hypothetical protein [Candidatus Woesearchaeota archaeon]